MMVATMSLPDHLLLFVAACVGTALLTPVAIRVAPHFGLVDRPSPHKFHRNPTPYLGGLAVAMAVLGGLLGIMFGQPELRAQFAAMTIGAAAVTVVGLVDDWRILNPLPRLLVQSAAAVGLWLADIRVAPTGFVVLDLALTILVVLTLTNAVNLIDNMDGLSTGTVAIASLFFFLLAYQHEQELVSIMAVLLAGACLGFLPFNLNPARIFLGDAGTHFLGFLLATLAIKLQLGGLPVVTRAVVPLYIVGVLLFDTTLVVVSRRRGGRPVFRGGTDHFSHRLVALGPSPLQVVLITYGACSITGVIGVALSIGKSVTLTWFALGAGLIVAAVLLVAFERVPRTGADDVLVWSGSDEPTSSDSPSRLLSLLHFGSGPESDSGRPVR
jgi:UDP-GlcNAc:undecaprenyl-phosphate GlcNAc-1-phosphate transferase